MKIPTPLAILIGAAAFSWTVIAEDDDAQAKEVSYFNGKKVPPLMEFTPDNFEKELKATKFTLIKHYSPYCPHCIDFAPTYQTLYEYYYTSQTPDPDVDFTKYYDFRFAAINCIAYYDLCNANGITAYPRTILFKDGVQLDTFKGVKNITFLSENLEKTLEDYKPGSRPKNLTLPTAGATSSEPQATDKASTDSSKESSKEADKEASKTDKSADDKVADKAKEGTDKVTPSDKAKVEDEKLSKDDKEKIKDLTKEAPKEAAEAAKEATKDSKTWPSFPFPSQVALKKPGKSSGETPNPEGKSLSLTAETFQTMVTMTQEPWFIKFYAPWCHHCQAMASNWAQLAKEMKGKLNVGEVNCDAESRLCKDVRLRGYPTILFFKGGERSEYDGLRGLGDFLSYAEKALDITAGVQDVDAESFKALEAKEEVIFVYFYDHATTSEDFMALERLTLSLIGHAKIVKTRDDAMSERFKVTSWPRLMVARDGRPTYYNPLTPKEMRDTHQVLNWIKSVWLPIVPELTASNAREIMDGKIVVLGILNRDNNENFISARREMKSAAGEWMDKMVHAFQLERQELRDAKQLRIEEAEDRNDQRALRAAKSIRINMDWSEKKEVAFAWVDGVFWQRWIRTTYGLDVKDGERVIINDEGNRRYWDITSTGNPILPSRTSILDTIHQVTASPPKIKPKLTISSFEKVFFDIRLTFTEHPYLTMGCVAGLAFGVISWLRGRMRRTRGGAFRLDDPRDHKGPTLFGGSVNGKVD